MKDEEAHRHYSDPENRLPAGPGRKLFEGDRKALSSHVPIRFRPDVINGVKTLADEKGITVSAWIRACVESELKRQLNRPVTLGVDAPPKIHWTEHAPESVSEGNPNLAETSPQ